MLTNKSSSKQIAAEESREASKSHNQSAPQGRVFLIDAMSHIFRAFFAPMSGRLEPLTNSHGQVTQAVFVFTNMLRKLLADEKPDYIAAVFESGVPTFRHESYAEYKSNRAEMPDDLSTQLPFIMRVCEVFNVTMINAPGFEADDVIGTLSVQAADKGLRAVIVSNDKDMCQLVRDPSVICMRQNSQNVKRKEPVPPIEWCDESWVENRFGVPPAQIIDLLGLMGDAVDNIPGAPGIGAKGAVQIVQQYGSIENAIARADEIKHKTYRESLKNNQPIILQSKELATIKTDVQVSLDLDELRMREPDRAAAYKLFRELEFKSLTREFAEGLSQTELETAIGITSERRYRIIRRQEDLENFARGLWDAEHWSFALAEKIDETKITSGKRKKSAKSAANADADAIDVDTDVAFGDAQTETDETISTNDDTNNDAKIDDSKSNNASLFDSILPKPDSLMPLAGVAIARSAGVAAYIDLENFDGDREQAIEMLRDLLSNGLLAKSVHDLKRAVALLAPLGIELEGVTDDTLLAAYLLDPVRGKYNLVDLARDAAGVEPFADAPEGWTQTQWETTEAADFTTQMADVLHSRILEQGLESIYAEIEIPLAPLLYKIEQAGLRVDTKVLGELSAYLGAELEKLTAKIYKEAGREFKIGSPKQVGEVLEELNISKGRKTSTGQVSTSRAVLEDLATKYELPKLIIEYRELDKLKTVYTDALPSQLAADGRIHSKLNQTVTATGRLSSSDPNLQNIPIRTEQGRRIRRAFVPADGKVFIAADYSQLELRLLAHITRDPVMLDAYQKGEDIHSRTAELVFNAKTKEELKEARRFAKIVNFAIAYAVEPFGLSARVGISMKEAKKVIDDYYDTYKGVREFMDAVPKQAKEQGLVRSLYGRIRPVPAIHDRNPQVRHRAEREAINMPIQGCLPYETRVLTSEGYYPIGELYKRGSDGLRVWTGTKFADFTVLNRGLCQLAELHLSNGQVLRCDTRHKVLTVTEDDYVWKHYADLAAADKVCLSLAREMEFGSSSAKQSARQKQSPHGADPHADVRLPFDVDRNEDFFYWFGFYMGDGWITHRPEEHRWSLAYSFGTSKKENRHVVRDRAEQCAAYFNGLGLKANYRQQSPQKGEMVIYSKKLIELFAGMGVNTGARAATKRVPDFVFRGSLALRKAFLRGFLAADGCAGSDGATSPSIHLCQRALLADLSLLLRTVGVETKLRGAYEYKGHTSYRLDFIGGMASMALSFTNRRHVHVPAMHAPQFVVEDFLRYVTPARLIKHSHKVMYSRLKHGGAVSIYTLAEMTKAAEAKLQTPLYAWTALQSKRELDRLEETYTLSVDDPLHRFDSEGVISKNTASDIVKIAMLRVDEAFRREGLQAQMVMQVHDELLVEAAPDEVERVKELMREAMERAVELDVPLEVEIGTGANWMDAK